MASVTKHYGKFRIRPFNGRGERLSLVFDTREEALLALKRYEAEALEIKLGLRGLRPRDRTVSELCDFWLKHRASKKRSGDGDVAIIRAHLRPYFGDERIVRVAKDQRLVDEYCASRSHLADATVRNHLTLLVSMLNAAYERRWLLERPSLKKPRVPVDPEGFRYLKSDAEVQRFLRAAKDEGREIHELYAVAVYSGLRAGELAGLRWCDVNFERRLFSVRRSYDGPTKSNRIRYVPILDPILVLLKERKLRAVCDLVFFNRRTKMLGKSARAFQEIFHRVLDAAGFETDGTHKHYIRFHDLRHTFASHWMMNGGCVFKLRNILGHADVKTTQRYAHLAPAAFADDFGRLGQSSARTVIQHRRTGY
ncbi:MAG: site-specific integrase [Myxococcota bacterium]